MLSNGTLKIQAYQGKSQGKVCVIMVNYNGKHLLREALDSIIAKTTYPNYQLILVDNGSTDGSVEFVRESYPWVALICNSENLGFAKANNQGIKACRADYYLLLNTDTKIYTKGWLTNLVRLLESEETIGIVSCSEPTSEKDLKKALKESYGAPKEVKFAPGSVMLIKKGTIENIGLLDEEFTPAYYEDTDWCYRALSAGWKILYDPTTIVFHYGGVTCQKVFRKIPRYFHIFTRNRIMFVLMNHSLADVPKDFITELMWIGSALLIGTRWERKQKLQSLLKAYSEVFLRLKRLLYKRRVKKRVRASV